MFLIELNEPLNKKKSIPIRRGKYPQRYDRRLAFGKSKSIEDPTIHDEDYDSDDPWTLHRSWHNQSVVFNFVRCAHSVIHLYVREKFEI